MSSFDEGSTPDPTAPTPPNAFSPTFLRRFDERDEPPTASEADTAGPWTVEPNPGVGFALYRAGESQARGFRPAALFSERWLALLAAAVLLRIPTKPATHSDGKAAALPERSGEQGSWWIEVAALRPANGL